MVMKMNSEFRALSSELRIVVVLVGPTASGKTAVSLPLAERLGAEIISADSRQIYRFMDIGTAKPTAADRARVPHHFVDILNPDQDYSAGEFGVRGREEIDRIFARGHVPLVVGGSGLYVRSLIDGIFNGPPADPEVRSIIEKQFANGGIDALLTELRRVDPVFAARVDPTKPRRMIRALEVYHVTGTPISQLHQDLKVEIPFVPLVFGLLWPKPELHRRINERCQAMLREGFLREVEDLVGRGYGAELNALNTVGYAEAFALRAGQMTLEEMVEVFSRNTRRYAKRQMTWFRRDERVSWIEMGGAVGVSDVVEKIISDVRDRISEI
jgi:tRNA dimethylallyltransferase